jgi:hypothetical protein
MLLQKLPPTLPLRVTGKITPSRYGFRRLCGRRISEEESNPERSCRNACLTWFCKLEVIGEPLCGSRLPLHTLAVGGAHITQHFGEYQSSELPPPRSICRRLTSHQIGSDQVKALFHSEYRDTHKKDATDFYDTV